MRAHFSILPLHIKRKGALCTSDTGGVVEYNV